MTCLDFGLLMVLSSTQIFCFIDELLAYVSSSNPQMNISSHLLCSLEGGIFWGATAKKGLLQFLFRLILNKVYLAGDVSRKLVVCSTDPF